MSRTLPLCVLLLVAGAAPAGDWPQWLGPNRDAVSAEVVKPWKGDPKVLWRVPVGDGHSSPIVAGKLVYLLTHRPEADQKDEEQITAYDATTGEVAFKGYLTKQPFKSMFGTGPRATPVVDGDQVFAYGVTGTLAAFGKTSGKIQWEVPALTEFKAPNLTFGVSSSPLIDGDHVIAMVGKGAGVVALDRKTGTTVWKALEDPASYASPIVIGTGENRTIAVLTQLGLIGLSPDGHEKWRYPFKDMLNESSTTPIVVGDLIVVGSVTAGSAAIRIGEKEGKPAVEQVWKRPELTCYFSTPVPVGADHLYIVTSALLKRTVALRCVETKTGKTLWTKDKIGKFHAALLRTGDNKLLMLEEAGNLVLIDPDPKEYRELARAKVCGETWAHPALANGRVYVRDAKDLICVQLGD